VFEYINKVHKLTNKMFCAFKNPVLSSRPTKLIVFISGFVFLLYFIGVFQFLNQKPTSLHLSAQSQRASIALNYYENNMNFFKPEIQRQTGENGITGVEFPIIYYTGAIFYKLFGFHDYYLRIISLLIVAFGLYQLCCLFNNYLGNYVLSTFLILAVSVSPVLMFYTPNFMPDAPSMALQMAAWSYFFRHRTSKRSLHLNLFILCATLSTLIKAPSFIIFVIVFILIVLDKMRFFSKKTEPNYFPNHKKTLLYLAFGFIATLGWYYYAHWLTNYYNNQSFALQPIIVDNWQTFDEIISVIKNLWLKYYFAYETYVLLIAATATLLLLFKFANRVLIIITTLYLIGLLFYVYLFFNQFKWHDYYIIALFPLLYFLVLTFSDLIIRFSNKYMKLLHIVFMLVLFFNLKESFMHCKKTYYERYSRDIYYWTGDYRAYEDLEPKLREMGIKRTDRFISGFDDTYCGSLYLMGQLGVTLYKNADFEEIDKQIKNPRMKYLVLNDSSKFNKIYPNEFYKKAIAAHRGLIIYKIK